MEFILYDLCHQFTCYRGFPEGLWFKKHERFLYHLQNVRAHIAYKGSEDHRYNVLNFIICHCSCARIRLLDYQMLWNWLDMQM